MALGPSPHWDCYTIAEDRNGDHEEGKDEERVVSAPPIVFLLKGFKVERCGRGCEGLPLPNSRVMSGSFLRRVTFNITWTDIAYD